MQDMLISNGIQFTTNDVETQINKIYPDKKILIFYYKSLISNFVFLTKTKKYTII